MDGIKNFTWYIWERTLERSGIKVTVIPHHSLKLKNIQATNNHGLYFFNEKQKLAFCISFNEMFAPDLFHLASSHSPARASHPGNPNERPQSELFQ